MTMSRTSAEIRKVTRELGNEILREKLNRSDEAVFHPFPHTSGDFPTWRLRFDPIYNAPTGGGIDLNDEIVLGREQDVPGFADLCQSVDAENLGVSRRHALLRPSQNKLFLLDLGSTNGTWINGHSIGVNMPYSLSNGDLVRIGRMEFTIAILKHPDRAENSSRKSNPIDSLCEISRAISSHLDLKEVLAQTLAMAMTYTPSDEVSIWLVDEHSGELFLEAEEGMEGERIQRLPVADTLAGQVVRTGKPMLVNREKEGGQIKIKTGYLVEAVIYVPIILGGATFGVLSAAHREKGKLYSPTDEKMMVAIADMTAVAIQNARLHNAVNRALANRSKVLTVLNVMLADRVKGMVNSTIGYAGLLQTDPSLSGDARETVTQIAEMGDRLINLIYQLNEAAAWNEEDSIQYTPFDFQDIVAQTVEDMSGFAGEKQIRLELQVVGNSYLMDGNVIYLHRAVFNVIDNAIRYSPPSSQVSIILMYGHNEIVLQVRDQGVGIPESDLPYIFDRYIRSEQSDGIGLGLYITRIAVEAHQGTVMIRNMDNGGIELTMTLPGTLRAG